MDAARSMSWSCLLLAQCLWQAPVPQANASLDRLKISTRTWAPRACICTRTGQLPPQTHRHGVASQGGFEQRSAHTFAEMVRAFVEDEKPTASAKARLQGMIAASRILRPKFFDPVCGGAGCTLCHICAETWLARYASAPDRESTPGGPAPLLAYLQSCVCRDCCGAHLACTAARTRGG